MGNFRTRSFKLDNETIRVSQNGIGLILLSVDAGNIAISLYLSPAEFAEIAAYVAMAPAEQGA